MSKNIIQVNVNKLVPHPNNPRKELGDLTELSDSIKENGILQNLTVVPHATMDGLYTVVIGHRRLQAAKDAGLEEVPTAIVQMDEKKQVSTMLLENMQRSELSMYEQAQGIQMCLDLGMSETDISTKTGFSKSTVRRRVKMLELDQDKVESATNATLEEYAKLESIEDLDKRNELIQFIGTNNFDYEVEKAKRLQDSVDNLNINETVVQEEASKSDTEVLENKTIESAKIAKELRTNFMKEIFKQKITGKEIALAVGVVNEFILKGGIKTDLEALNEIVNPKSLEQNQILEHASKHRTNYFVVAAYTVLESDNNLNDTYDYLKELGYQLSDDEMELLENA